MVAVTDDEFPPLKSSSATQLPTAPAPELICSTAGRLTVSDTVVVCVTLPLTPVIVNVDVTVGVLPVVVTVSVELPAPVTVAGE
jgi:hypothetical protein